MRNQKNDRCSLDQDRLIRYAYDDLPLFARLVTRWHLKKCCSCQNLFRQHQTVAKTLSKNRKQSLPPHVLADIKSQTGAQNRIEPISWRMVVVTTAIIAIVTGWVVMETPTPNSSQQYSPTEVTHARDQVDRKSVV
jgi:predicted anti-sigma-YlaC factor YlaD